ncbi:uncharacterized protein G2W53_037617 [Senna tora]|uniref:Uncharacterized protein n=1 Tax=Senna tora TaxID=362788 RepID=A0A834SKS5_9FABA|nr:uncharacterized protein G2W53_037617 [Senna tora]
MWLKKLGLTVEEMGGGSKESGMCERTIGFFNVCT